MREFAKGILGLGVSHCVMCTKSNNPSLILLPPSLSRSTTPATPCAVPPPQESTTADVAKAPDVVRSVHPGPTATRYRWVACTTLQQNRHIYQGLSHAPGSICRSAFRGNPLRRYVDMLALCLTPGLTHVAEVILVRWFSKRKHTFCVL